MGEITNYNCHKQCADICSERFCDNLAEYYIVKTMGKDEFLIAMCKKHYFRFLRGKFELMQKTKQKALIKQHKALDEEGVV